MQMYPLVAFIPQLLLFLITACPLCKCLCILVCVCVCKLIALLVNYYCKYFFGLGKLRITQRIVLLISEKNTNTHLRECRKLCALIGPCQSFFTRKQKQTISVTQLNCFEFIDSTFWVNSQFANTLGNLAKFVYKEQIKCLLKFSVWEVFCIL